MKEDELARDTPGSHAPGLAGASHRVEKTLQLAHLALSPTTVDKARGRSAFGLPEPPPLSAPPLPPPHPSAWAALRASGKAGALVSAVLLGVGFGAGYWLGRAETRAAAPIPALGGAALAAMPSAAPADAPPRLDALARGPSEPAAEASGAAPDEDAQATSPALPLREPSLQSPARTPKAPVAETELPRAHTPGPARTGGGSRNAEELALMRRIERSLRNEQPAIALALLAEAEARFPNSSLDEERLAASVMAHCGLQNPGHARRAENFLQSRPRSVYRTRVLAACDAARVPNAPDDRTTASEGKRPRGDQ